MEAYTWLIILAAWSLLLALGLAGGDPLAMGQPGREALAVKLAKWMHHTMKERQGASVLKAPALPPHAVPARQSGSGFHAVA